MPDLTATNQSDAPINLTVQDPVTGESATAQVYPGDYAIICAEPCFVEHAEADFETGTVVLTIKGYRRRSRSDG